MKYERHCWIILTAHNENCFINTKNLCGNFHHIYFSYYSSSCIVEIPECANKCAQCFSPSSRCKTALMLFRSNAYFDPLICVYLLLFCLFLAPSGTPMLVLYVCTFTSFGGLKFFFIFISNLDHDKTQMYVQIYVYGNIFKFTHIPPFTQG